MNVFIAKYWKNYVVFASLFLFSATAHAGQEFIVNSTIPNNFFGNQGLSGTDSFSEDPSHNTVIVGTNATITGNVAGAQATIGDNATNNTLIINGGTVEESAYGANVDTGNAMSNTLIINGGTVEVNAYGAHVKTGNATHNTLIINGGIIAGGAHGAHVDIGNATYNTLTFNEGYVDGIVTGGAVFSGNATYNILNIGPKAYLKPNLLFGGYGYDSALGIVEDIVTGNTLNSLGWAGYTTEVKNFQYLNFVVPASTKNGSTLISAQNIVLGSPTATPEIAITAFEEGFNMQTGESFTLLEAYDEWETNNVILHSGTAHLEVGFGMDYAYKLTETDKAITATIVNKSPSPLTQSFSQAQNAGLALQAMGSDLIASDGIKNASSKGMNGGSLPYSLTPFAALSGGSLKYNVGQGVNTRGFNMLTGLALNFNTDAYSNTLGLFFEGGWGNYSSKNVINSLSYTAKGNTEYLGLGVLARSEYRGFYGEFSFRGGRGKLGYKSTDILYNSGYASYKTSGTYYGLHAGLGYVTPVSPDITADFYAKYFWNYLGKDSASIFNQEYKFSATSAHRMHIGSKATFTLNANFTPYIGLAYEYQFSGTPQAYIDGARIFENSVKGSTGIAELGISYQNRGFTVDLKAQGFVGKKEGVTGNLQVKYKF